MPVIHAVYENGVFRPKEPVDLPESSEVEVELRSVVPATEERNSDAIYAILEARFESGDVDGAAKHDEHQP
jgi:predicted DNA-binding antitoxin AbrB/MazE fold protein